MTEKFVVGLVALLVREIIGDVDRLVELVVLEVVVPVVVVLVVLVVVELLDSVVVVIDAIVEMQFI